jgi:hypothetical protein
VHHSALIYCRLAATSSFSSVFLSLSLPSLSLSLPSCQHHRCILSDIIQASHVNHARASPYSFTAKYTMFLRSLVSLVFLSVRPSVSQSLRVVHILESGLFEAAAPRPFVFRAFHSPNCGRYFTARIKLLVFLRCCGTSIACTQSDLTIERESAGENE